MRTILVAFIMLFTVASPVKAGDFLAYTRIHFSPGVAIGGATPWHWGWSQEKTVVFLNIRTGPTVGNLIASRFIVFADSISVAHLPGSNNFLIAAQHFFFKRPLNAKPTTIYEVHLSPHRGKPAMQIIRTVHCPWNFIDDTKGHVCNGIQAGPDGIVWEMRSGRGHNNFANLVAFDWKTQKQLGRCRLCSTDLGMAGMPIPLNHAALIFAYPNFKQTQKHGVPKTFFGKLRIILVTANGDEHIIHLGPKIPDKPFLCATLGDHIIGVTGDCSAFVSFSIGPGSQLLGQFSRELPLRSMYPKYNSTLEHRWDAHVHIAGFADVNRGVSVALIKWGAHRHRLVFLNAANGNIIRVEPVKRSIQWLRVWHKKLYLVSYSGKVIPVESNGQFDAAFGEYTYIGGVTVSR